MLTIFAHAQLRLLPAAAMAPKPAAKGSKKRSRKGANPASPAASKEAKTGAKRERRSPGSGASPGRSEKRQRKTNDALQWDCHMVGGARKQLSFDDIDGDDGEGDESGHTAEDDSHLRHDEHMAAIHQMAVESQSVDDVVSISDVFTAAVDEYLSISTAS